MKKNKRGKSRARSDNARKQERAPSGQFASEDPRTTVLAARARKMGKDATKREIRLAHTGEIFETDVGRCIAHLCGKEEAAELWKVWAAFTAAEATFRRRILGQTGFPSGMKLEMLPELFESDQGHSIDTRSETERDRDATNRVQYWRGVIGRLPVHQRALIYQAERGHAGDIWANAGPTARGRTLVSAVRVLAQEAE